MTAQSEWIKHNYESILEKTFRSAKKAGRDPGSIRIVVVTKAQPVEIIQNAIDADVKYFGENYPEETEQKILQIKRSGDFEWHMIGHLQSRKAKIVADHFHCMHSIDRVSIAEKLNSALAERGKILPVMLEFNVGGEETKGGWDAYDPSKWDLLIPEIERLTSLRQLRIIGLMTMPPLFENPEKARPFFVRLRLLKDYFAKQVPLLQFNELSMGTSADFEIAVEEGATMVRIGTAIVGPRPDRLERK